MIGQFFERIFGGKENLFWLVFAVVTFTLVGASFWVITFVQNQVTEDEEMAEAATSPVYVDFETNPEEYISAEAYLAMADYSQQNQETQNVEVLVGLSPMEITNYMTNHVSGALGVGCTYCHSLENFAADEWGDPEAEANKSTARIHLQMTQDLNQNWLTQLSGLTPEKQPSGAQIACATCHNGVAQPEPWPRQGQGATLLPPDFRLPLDEPISADEQDILNVNGRVDIGLTTVQYNQNVMYHMNYSMNVGCTHCHNSRYFPSKEVPTIYYAVNMLQMSQHIWAEYGDTLNDKQPSCLMCHQQAIIPPGSAQSVDVLPASLVPQDTATLP